MVKCPVILKAHLSRKFTKKKINHYIHKIDIFINTIHCLFEQHDNSQYFQTTKCLLKDIIICKYYASNTNYVTRYSLSMLHSCCHHS